MTPTKASPFRLTVLNPGGRDLAQDFRETSEAAPEGHPPVNIFAYAACTNGAFHRETKQAIAEDTPVLLLLRGNFKATERALDQLKKEKRKVAVYLKETGLHQIAQQLANRVKLARFLRILSKADGCLASTPEAAEIYQHARPKSDPATVAFIPTPYPLQDRHWNFAKPPNEQSGIFIGTREWDVPSRNHAAALLAARKLSDVTGEPVTVFNFNGRKGRNLLAEMDFPGGKLRILDERKPYLDYMREVARHKIVFQLDRSRVPGQVAGDALLCRTICVGGDGAIDRFAFPQTCGEGRTSNELAAIAADLLKDTNKRATLILETQWRAMEQLSFQAIRPQLQTFFERLSS
jgi:hypothetical protein